MSISPPPAAPLRFADLWPGVIAASSFAICNVLSKIVLAAGSDVLTLSLFRGLVGVALMFIWLRIGIAPPPHTADARWISLGLGILFAGVVFGLFAAISIVTVPIAILTYFVYPLFTGIVGALLGIERIGWRGALTAVTAFLGLALMIGAHTNELALSGLAFAIRRRDLPHRDPPGHAIATAEFRSPGHHVVSDAVLDSCPRVGVPADLELARAANRDRLGCAYWRQHWNYHLRPGAVRVDQAHRTVPKCSDHVSGTTAIDCSERASAGRDHYTHPGDRQCRYASRPGRISAPALTVPIRSIRAQTVGRWKGDRRKARSGCSGRYPLWVERISNCRTPRPLS